MKRNIGFPDIGPSVTSFLIIIISTYLVIFLSSQTYFGQWLYQKLILNPYDVIYSGQVWRIFTYAFLHDKISPFHVIFNCLMLYILGNEMENYLGEKKFLLFCFCAIFLGGIFVCLSFLLGLSSAHVMGFSAVTIGLLILWGLSFKDRNIYFFGLLPLSGLQMVFLTIGLEFLYAFFESHTSSAAHFGGILTGLIFYFLPLVKKKF